MKNALIAVLVTFLSLGTVFGLSARDWQGRIENESTRSDALAELVTLDGEELDAAREGLKKAYKAQLKWFEKTWKKTNDVFPGYGKIGDDGMMKMIMPWIRAQEEAWKIIWDEQVYPFPPGGRASGPCKGYDQVRPRLSAAKDAMARLDGMARKSILLVLKKRWAKNLEKLKACAMLLVEYDDALESVDSSHVRFAIPSFVFLDALQLIGEDRVQDANRLYASGSFSEAQRYLYFLVISHYIEFVNANRIRSGMDSGSKKAVTILNEYRMAIGVLPYEHDPLLTQAIQGHQADIASGRTPFAHQSQVPGKASPQDRVAQTGFVGACNENLASMGGAGAVDCWFWDGGHGRNQVNPQMEKIGFGSGSGGGFNNGRDGKNVVPRPVSPFPTVAGMTAGMSAGPR
jgi:uncharacterized protein YkwD